MALIINELVLNAGRHAYPDCPDGVIRLQLLLSDDKAVSISISDDGVGLPSDSHQAAGHAHRSGVPGQLGAELKRQESTKGTHYLLVVSLHVAAANGTSLFSPCPRGQLGSARIRGSAHGTFEKHANGH